MGNESKIPPELMAICLEAMETGSLIIIANSVDDDETVNTKLFAYGAAVNASQLIASYGGAIEAMQQLIGHLEKEAGKSTTH